MTIRIERVHATTPALEDFLSAQLRDMASTSPADSSPALDMSRLLAPDVRLFAAEAGGKLIGTGALAALEPGHEELTSMRTAPAMRGKGIGSAILTALVDDARERGIRRVSLETGASDRFWAAHRLYSKAGFDECEPFGPHAEDPYSVYLSLRIAA